MEKGQLRRKPATNLIPRKANKPSTSNKAELLLVLLLNTNKELQPIFVSKPLLGSFPFFHLTSGSSTLLSTLESLDRSLDLQSICIGIIPRML
jgi:hypothetical protein